ncbi:substrate-binding domain-containing protein [Inmirania thermothiophila]|nr:substrate-binding domain-containing protein [Inmirania thermothiophila]
MHRRSETLHGARGAARRLLALLAAALLPALVAAAPPGGEVVRLATTTSTENSGLLRAILPAFQGLTGYRVDVVAVGTGKALRMGRDGDVDVVLVHAPPAEARFVEAGYGVNRRAVMYNDFVLVGPARDPARVRGLMDAAEALRRIAAAGAPFLSRGDDSGTHKKERALWRAAAVAPQGRWYRETGQGMGRTLQMASELGAYTLVDRGTWLSQRARLALEVLVEGDARLRNPYSVIAVNPARWRDVNYLGAMALIAWLTSPEGQARIGAYRIGGEVLFHPVAVPPKE